MAREEIEARLSATAASGGFGAEVVAALGTYISGAEDADLFRMSPLRYGRPRGLSDREAIDLFLHATRAGILDFSWGVVCPGCAGFLSTAAALKNLKDQRYCAFCRVPVPVELDDNTEVAFTVSPTTRRLRFHDAESLTLGADDFAMFFSTSLADDSPFHETLRKSLIATTHLRAESSAELELDLSPGQYVLLAPLTHGVVHLSTEKAAGPEAVEVDILPDRVIPDVVSLSAGPARLRLRNRSGRGAAVGLFPDPVPPPEARPADCRPPGHELRPHLTAKALISTQAFRDLFRAESLPGDAGIEIKALTLLFTDLAGSTALYEEVGDLNAYTLVREHFDVLRDIVADRGGAVVKTIGDAIMASFAEATPGMEAAVAMLDDIRSVGPGEQLAIKIGLHAGPCIAVELNDRLDYFGRTVNIAARVQGLAGAQEIVCTDHAWGLGGVQGAAAGLAAREDRASLKGIEGEVPVMRLR